MAGDISNRDAPNVRDNELHVLFCKLRFVTCRSSPFSISCLASHFVWECRPSSGAFSCAPFRLLSHFHLCRLSALAFKECGPSCCRVFNVLEFHVDLPSVFTSNACGPYAIAFSRVPVTLFHISCVTTVLFRFFRCTSLTVCEIFSLSPAGTGAVAATDSLARVVCERLLPPLGCCVHD